MTCWRRLHEWMRAGVWQRVHEAILRRLREHDQIMWDRACVDAASVPAPAGGEHTGRNPTDRGKLGCKHHLLVDERGLPLVAQISGAQVHDSRFLIPLVESIPAVKGLAGRARKRPGKLHADRAYASRAHRAWLRSRGIAARIARYGVESGERLGRWRWVVERTLGWLHRASADCASGMSGEQTCTRRSCRLPARSSVGGVSGGFVRRSKATGGGEKAFYRRDVNAIIARTKLMAE